VTSGGNIIKYFPENQLTKFCRSAIWLKNICQNGAPPRSGTTTPLLKTTNRLTLYSETTMSAS